MKLKALKDCKLSYSPSGPVVHLAKGDIHNFDGARKGYVDNFITNGYLTKEVKEPEVEQKPAAKGRGKK